MSMKEPQKLDEFERTLTDPPIIVNMDSPAIKIEETLL